MLDVGGIDPAAVGQYPAFLFGIERDLVAVKYRLESFGGAVGQPVYQLIFFQCLYDDITGIIRFHFLILNPHGFNGDDRGFGAKPVAAGGPDFNLFRKPLALYFIVEGFQNTGSAVCSAAGHAHMHFNDVPLLSGQNLVAEPLELSYG